MHLHCSRVMNNSTCSVVSLHCPGLCYLYFHSNGVCAYMPLNLGITYMYIPLQYGCYLQGCLTALDGKRPWSHQRSVCWRVSWIDAHVTCCGPEFDTYSLNTNVVEVSQLAETYSSGLNVPAFSDKKSCQRFNQMLQSLLPWWWLEHLVKTSARFFVRKSWYIEITWA